MKQFPKLLSEEMLLITPAGYQRVKQAFESGERLMGEDDMDDDEEQEMHIDNGIACIPIHGPIGRSLSEWDKLCGACDCDDIQEMLLDADRNYAVKGILLDFDSPGGMVNGTPETADVIAGTEKPIYAYSGGMIASAAFWMASACDSIWTTKSADVGSIGVYTPFVDLSEMAKQMGIKVQVFASGKYKGMGIPGTSLTDDQANLLQERVQEIAGMFYQHVTDNRPDVKQEDMQGQIFKADQAVKRGFIDGVCPSMDWVCDLMR